MFKKHAIQQLMTPQEINYNHCLNKIRQNHPNQIHLFDDICKISAGMHLSPTNTNKFMDLWFKDPSVVDTVFAKSVFFTSYFYKLYG